MSAVAPIATKFFDASICSEGPQPDCRVSDFTPPNRGAAKVPSGKLWKLKIIRHERQRVAIKLEITSLLCAEPRRMLSTPSII
jgi:hypothetical protein